MTFFEKLGFSNHPFETTNADEEPDLEKYFVAPPYFNAVIGDPTRPTASIVIAPRGGGKSAQRRMVEKWSLENKVLTVTYDRFEFGANQKLAEISLNYHLRNIITRILLVYLSALADDPDFLLRLESSERETVQVFVKTYIGDMPGGELQKVLTEIRTVPERIKIWWNKNVPFLEPVVNFLLTQKGFKEIDLPDVKHEDKTLDATYKRQLEILHNLIVREGFQSIYVLVDKIDETELTGNNPEASFKLIRALIQDLDLLSMSGFGYKFFVWDKVYPHFQKFARPDRVKVHSLAWSRLELTNVLQKRLQAFSGTNIHSFNDLLENGVDEIDSILALLANGSPRNLVRICESIFTVHSEEDPEGTKISNVALTKGIDDMCSELCIEAYGPDVVRDLMRIGRELFTINYISNDIFKFNANSGRAKVKNWSNLGIVKQIGTVSVSTSNKPVNFYHILDPALNRVVTSTKIPITDFVKSRWLVCEKCSSDNLMNPGLIPNGNDLLCHSCGQNLV